MPKLRTCSFGASPVELHTRSRREFCNRWERMRRSMLSVSRLGIAHREVFMKRMAVVTATFVAIVLGCVSVWLPEEPVSRAQSSADAAAAVQGPRFKKMYQEWSAAHEKSGGDRNVLVT